MEHTTRKRIGAAEITAILRRQIASGQLQPRDRLPPERVLAEAHGVARGTVREALTRLAREGLVEIKPGSGTYVIWQPAPQADTVIENARPLELIDARFALEPHICRLAVLHARRQDFERAEELLARMELSETDPVGFSEADAEFHSLLAEVTGNGLLLGMVNQINSVRDHEQWARMKTLTLNPSIIQQYNAQHRQIVNAIRAREPERAAALMKDHLETARLSLTRAAAT
jgi:GntR family uxuAB operon transcriptional repressor